MKLDIDQISTTSAASRRIKFYVNCNGILKYLFSSIYSESSGLMIAFKSPLYSYTPQPEIENKVSNELFAGAAFRSRHHKVSIHHTRGNQIYNIIKWQMDHSSGSFPSASSVTSALKQNNRFAFICLRLIGDLAPEHYNSRVKGKYTNIVLGNYNPKQTSMMYALFVTRKETESIYFDSYEPVCNTTVIDIGEYKLVILTSLFNLPATDRFMSSYPGNYERYTDMMSSEWRSNVIHNTELSRILISDGFSEQEIIDYLENSCSSESILDLYDARASTLVYGFIEDINSRFGRKISGKHVTVWPMNRGYGLGAQSAYRL